MRHLSKNNTSVRYWSGQVTAPVCRSVVTFSRDVAAGRSWERRCSAKAWSILQLLQSRVEREHWLWTWGISGKRGRCGAVLNQKAGQRQLLLGHCAQTWKGQPKPPSATLACTELQNQNKALSGADGPVSWMSYTILSGCRKWNVSTSLSLRLCVWLGLTLPASDERGRDLIMRWLNVIH